MIGTWVLYLPHIKTKFGLDDSEIGMALFSLALGLLASIPFIPFINSRIGVGRSTQLGIIVYALAFNLPLIAPNYIALCASLFIVGLFSGFTDISMNALVSTIEKKRNKLIMSASHGFFSLGGFIGASIGSLLMSIMLEPSWHMLLVSVLIVVTNLYFSRYYYHIREEVLPRVKHKNRFKNIGPLLGLAIAAFVIMLNEGAVEHWSNLFLFDVVKVPENKSGLGFIAFSLCMTIGRFLGDGISKSRGSIYIISGGCIIAFFGYLCVVSAQLVLSVLGFGILGLGLSVIIPEIYRLAGNTKGVLASVGISIVSGIGYAGFLAGPVIIGLISDWTNLVWSFAFQGFLVILALCLTLFKLKKMYRFM